MCRCMRKLQEERQVPADAHDWCQIAFSFNVPKIVSKYVVVDVKIYDTIPILPSHILSYANMPYQILFYADWNIYDW